MTSRYKVNIHNLHVKRQEINPSDVSVYVAALTIINLKKKYHFLLEFGYLQIGKFSLQIINKIDCNRA